MSKGEGILVTNLTDFNYYDWDNKPVFNNYQRLRSYIVANLGADYQELFAIPKSNKLDNGEIIVKWLAPQLGHSPVRLSELVGPDRDKYKQLLEGHLREIRQLIENIQDGGKEIRWADLLQRAIQFGGDNYVFVGNEKLVIAAWSMLPKSKEPDTPGSLGATQRPQETSEQVTEPASSPSNTSQPNPEFEPLEKSVNHHSDPTRAEEHPDPVPEEIPPEPQPVPEPANAPPITPSKKKQFNWRWVWLLILLLIGAMLIWLLIDKNDNSLPEEPGVIVPIEPGDIGLDDDSLVVIALDRLNIALNGENQDLEKFSKDFKAAYPNTTFKIIYYDTLTRRLQIELPKELRETVKEELPQKLPEYDMLIWSESLFQRNSRQTTDPGFQDRRKSWHLQTVKADVAWQKTMGSDDIVVAVIDNGFDLSHPELRHRIYKPYNVVERSTNVFTNISFTHGTHVAGLAVGQIGNGFGVAGVSPGCKFMPIQVADRNGNMSTTSIVDAILYAINNGADVVNLSLGLSMAPSVSSFPKHIQRDMIQQTFRAEEAFWDQIFAMAEKKNVTLVIAGGNQNIMVGLDPMQRNPLGIKVNAIAPNLTKADFSNFGGYSTISAPGVQIYSSMPGNQYDYLDGTSMASPMVAGGVALIKSVNKNITTSEIIDLLINTGRPLSHNSGEVGNLMQLDRALGILSSSTPSNPITRPGTPPASSKCAEIAEEIDRLQKELDRLKSLCNGNYAKSAPDTLKMPDAIDNLDFLSGRWKSTTTLNNDNGDQVLIYFDFRRDGTGQITFLEPGNVQCRASLKVRSQSNYLTIDQRSEANCSNSVYASYQAYSFEFKADRTGTAVCKAQNKKYTANRFDFKLIKTQ